MSLRFKESEARYILTHVVEGMKFLNLHNIVHRDLKVDNILVSKKLNAPHAEFKIEDFEFKLADLGLARSLDSPDEWIKTMCGTPICMAPEIVVGCLYNYKVDVWSVGTLLFHLLTGMYPFKGKNIEELKGNLIKGAYKIPKDVQVSVECLDFLNCCLRFDSKQ